MKKVCFRPKDFVKYELILDESTYTGRLLAKSCGIVTSSFSTFRSKLKNVYTMFREDCHTDDDDESEPKVG